MNRLTVTCTAAVVLAAGLSPAPLAAQDDTAEAIAALKAENERLAARIDALEALLKDRRQETAAQSEPTEASLASPSDRQTVADAARSSSRAPLVRDVSIVVPPAPAERPVQGGGIGLQLNSSNGGGQVAITVGQSLRSTNVAPDQVDASATTWSLVASAPVAKSGDTSLGTLDSFTNASTLRLRVGKLFMTLPNLLTDSDYLQIVQAATDACEASAGSPAARLACSEADVDQGFIAKWAPARVADYIRLTSEQGFAWGFGVEGTIGYREFEFIEAATFADQSREEIPWGAKVFGTILPAPDLAFVASLAYEQGYRERDTRTFCPAGVGTQNVVCIVGADGRPASVERVLLGLEARKLFDLRRGRLQNGILDRFGIAPQMTYDANNDEFGVDVPIYLTADDKGNLIGGIRLGYETGDAGFNAGVFVGSSFELFKR